MSNLNRSTGQDSCRSTVQVNCRSIANGTAAAPQTNDKIGAKEVKVHGLNYLVNNIQHHDRLLIVDDVFDSGRSIEAIIEKLTELARLNTPEDIRVAVPYYKPERNQTAREPDYFLYETQAWLKYPHSLEGLSKEEIAINRPELYNIIKKHL